MMFAKKEKVAGFVYKIYALSNRPRQPVPHPFGTSTPRESRKKGNIIYMDK